jgi:hypothetical protein
VVKGGMATEVAISTICVYAMNIDETTTVGIIG